LSTDETFAEGSVRLNVEYGETYSSNEILLNIIIEINKKKDYKEFIGNPNQDKLTEMKSLFCKLIGVKDEDFRLYKVNSYNDPVKQIKNENQLIANSGLKDNDHLYLRNVNEDPYENYVLRIFLNLDEKDRTSYFYEAIPENNKVLEITVNKNTTIAEIKQKVINDLNLKLDNNINKLRLRCISKIMDAGKILRGKETQIKKLNIDNPANILVEILDQNEDLTENQMQIFLLRKDSKTNNYETKNSFLFEYQNLASSDRLYEACRQHFNLRNIALSKYAKSYYKWEYLPEIDEEGAVNLRKNPYSLRDGGNFCFFDFKK